MNSPYWFEVAVMCALLCLGNIVLQGFAQHESSVRRIGKMIVGVAIAVGVSAAAGRAWFFALLGAYFIVLVVIHAWWLPKHGIHGITAEPREKYFALRGWKTKPPA